MSKTKNHAMATGDIDVGRIPGEGQGLPRREFKYGLRRDKYRCWDCKEEYHAKVDEAAKCPKCGCGRYIPLK